MSTVIDLDLEQRIVQYYVEAGMDYGSWSKGFNMHFGFGSIWKIFQRERMLNRMSDEVLKRLNLDHRAEHIADLGCGVGATMRRGAAVYKHCSFTGLTIVPWQKTKGEEMNRKQGFSHRISIETEDYHNSSLPAGRFDGVYAIESACYSPVHLQSRLIREVHRVLKEGGRFVIADGFLKTTADRLNPCVRGIYNGICSNWALPGMMNINQLKTMLMEQGFKNVVCEEVSWRVAPSVLHVPFVILKFVLGKKMQGEKLSMQSIRNLKGSFQTLLLGLHQWSFGYYLVSAQK